MIQPVNNNTALYAGAGLGAGIAGGAAYGYFSKPFLKNGEVTDKFVTQYSDKVVKDDIKEAEKLTKYLKKILDTGSIEGIPDTVLEDIGDSSTDLKSMTSDARKAYAKSIVQEGYEEHGVNNWRDLIKKSKEAASESLTSNRLKSIASYDNLLFAEGTKPEVMKEVLMKNVQKLHLKINFMDEAIDSIIGETPVNKIDFMGMPLDEAVIDAIVDGKSVKEVNEYILNAKTLEKKMFDDERKFLKEGLTDYLTGKKTGTGTMIDLASEDGKSAAKRVDKLVRKVKLGAAAKWAAIGGGALALTGAIVAMFTGNKKA